MGRVEWGNGCSSGGGDYVERLTCDPCGGLVVRCEQRHLEAGRNGLPSCTGEEARECGCAEVRPHTQVLQGKVRLSISHGPAWAESTYKGPSWALPHRTFSKKLEFDVRCLRAEEGVARDSQEETPLHPSRSRRAGTMAISMSPQQRPMTERGSFKCLLGTGSSEPARMAAGQVRPSSPFPVSTQPPWPRVWERGGKGEALPPLPSPGQQWGCQPEAVPGGARGEGLNPNQAGSFD